jgi:CRISPR-associated endonuclease/helicase Cas3
LLSPQAMARFYAYYFFERKGEMAYDVTVEGRTDTLVNMLGLNTLARADYQRCNKGGAPSIMLQQSFMAAAKQFAAIEAPTQGVVVPYGDKGKEVIGKLSAAFNAEAQATLLREAQPYTVNVFPYELRKLADEKAVRETQEGSGFFYLTERYYDETMGLSMESVGTEELLHA